MSRFRREVRMERMLHLLDALFGLNLSDEEGEALAAELGSDCPSSGGPASAGLRAR